MLLITLPFYFILIARETFWMRLRVLPYVEHVFTLRRKNIGEEQFTVFPKKTSCHKFEFSHFFDGTGVFCFIFFDFLVYFTFFAFG